MKRKEVIAKVCEICGGFTGIVWDDSWYVEGGKTRRLKFWGLEKGKKEYEKMKERLIGKRVGKYRIVDVRENRGWTNDVCVMMWKKC